MNRNIRFNESTDIHISHEMAMFVEEHGDMGVGLLEYMQGDLSEAKAALNRYFGVFPNGEAFAKAMCNLFYELPMVIRDCIDFSALWQKLNKTGYFAIKTKEGMQIFRNKDIKHTI